MQTQEVRIGASIKVNFETVYTEYVSFHFLAKQYNGSFREVCSYAMNAFLSLIINYDFRPLSIQNSSHEIMAFRSEIWTLNYIVER